MNLESPYLFALCQAGAEAALKRELGLAAPELRSAYQRKGLVTFKSTASPLTPDLVLTSALARCYGVSLGSLRLEDARAVIMDLPRPLRLHVVERELHRPDEGPETDGVLARELEASLRASLPEAFANGEKAREGELVLDVIVGPDDLPLYGLHRHVRGRSPHPGGRYPRIELPDAPSRAYQKIEDAIRAFELPVRAGDTAVELGAAPGGATRALLERGVHVCAIDPADMSESVLAYVGKGGARAHHLQSAMAGVERQALPASAEWLLLDVHLAPQVALRGAARFARMFRDSLLGAVLTLKLNDWAFMDQLPRFLTRARELGLSEPVARQLPSHRQELAIVGLTERGSRRARGLGSTAQRR